MGEAEGRASKDEGEAFARQFAWRPSVVPNKGIVHWMRDARKALADDATSRADLEQRFNNNQHATIRLNQ